MKKVFITGGAGFVGSNLCSEFVNSNYEVHAFDSNVQYFYPMNKYSIKNMKYRHEHLLKNVNLIRGSTLDVNDLRRTINDIKPNYIINLAALPLAVTAIKKTEEAFSSILETTQNLLEIIRDNEFIEKYIHISSSMVYGDFIENPNPENAIKEPKEIYGSFKLASEYLVKGYAKRYNFNSVIIRPSAVYGPTDNNYRVIQKFIESAFEKKKLIANKPRSNRLDFTYVKDLVKGIKLSAVTDLDYLEVFNLTRGEGRTLQDVIDILRQNIGEFDIEVNDDDSFYPKRGALDISNAKNKLNYNPSFSLEDGIKDYISFLKD